MTDKDVVLQAIIDEVMTLDAEAFEERLTLVEEEQPVLFFSVVALQEQEIEVEKVYCAIQVLLILHTYVGHVSSSPMREITDEDMGVAFKRFIDMMAYLEKETDRDSWSLMYESYPEPELLNYLLGHLRSQGVTGQVEEDAMVIAVMKSVLDLYVELIKEQAE
ncbi:MAG: hypothetical protein EOL87_01795 [Spartobacteria bacterium]|nr:hypothetical protein [Spartobacteria bacterium]